MRRRKKRQSEQYPLQTEEGELSVGRASVAPPAKRKQ
ncbi:hypothetical protein SPAB_05502 [Salmonella enterica subsp. enterica serovar Paratyphi B str. SPB7]|uniref:Uncharacterized protein n=1 Tax=Salmonella paratyphi B (strain ATCC BAA-1250 / SPB7) TaxID=1016998 RepID=A0A6C6ZB63_SALPB|nr:hypothetical protein SPAB_05502 [Salmonella enterica subsp. enterica serovar Paratyphi B str. SPB7]